MHIWTHANYAHNITPCSRYFHDGRWDFVKRVNRFLETPTLQNKRLNRMFRFIYFDTQISCFLLNWGLFSYSVLKIFSYRSTEG